MMDQLISLTFPPPTYTPLHTALAGKSILRLYLALIGFLFGAFVSYVALERIAQSQDMGPNKEIIQLVVGIVAGTFSIHIAIFK